MRRPTGLRFYCAACTQTTTWDVADTKTLCCGRCGRTLAVRRRFHVGGRPRPLLCTLRGRSAANARAVCAEPGGRRSVWPLRAGRIEEIQDE